MIDRPEMAYPVRLLMVPPWLAGYKYSGGWKHPP